MTLNDYIGAILAIVIAILMVGAYIYAFSPKNKSKFEASKHILFKEDDTPK